MRCLALAFALTACGVTDPADPTGPGGGKADDPTTHTLPGFDETLLAGDSDDGMLALVRVGDALEVTPIETDERSGPAVIRARGGLFYALFPDGTLAVIDPVAKKIVKRHELPAGAVDFVWANERELFVSQGAKNTIARFDLEQDLQTDVIELPGLLGTAARMELRRMRRIGHRLYVQVARTSSFGRADRSAVVVVDTNEKWIETTIELQAIDDTGSGLTGYNPDLDMAYDEQRSLLYVSALGERPSSTGGLFRIDTERLALHDVKRAQSGFQGIATLASPTTAFIIYHTSTPTTSSHLFDYRITADGELEPTDGGALVDAFDGLDALAIDAQGKLVAMANNCVTGFCIGGAGINFVDAETSEVLPKLREDKLGFEPSIVAFLD
jgi:hypothetical protein